MFVCFINFEGCIIIILCLSLFYFFVHLFHGENKYLKFDILSFEYKPDGFLSDRIKYLSLDRNYEYNESNRMKKEKEVVWVYTFLHSSSRKTIPFHIFEP